MHCLPEFCPLNVGPMDMSVLLSKDISLADEAIDIPEYIGVPGLDGHILDAV